MPGRCPDGIHHNTSVLFTGANHSFAAGVEALVQRLPDEALQRLHIFPHRQIRQNGRVVIDSHVHGMPALVLQTPDEAGHLLGKTVHAFDVVDEFGHARIIERITDPRDVELGEMAGWRCMALTPPPRAPRRANLHCANIHRCAARSPAGSAAATPAPARQRHRQRRKWCDLRSAA